MKLSKRVTANIFTVPTLVILVLVGYYIPIYCSYYPHYLLWFANDVENAYAGIEQGIWGDGLLVLFFSVVAHAAITLFSYACWCHTNYLIKNSIK